MSKSKNIIMAFATILLSSASGALAYDDPENKLGDRYPLLERSHRPLSALTPSQVARVDRSAVQEPENKLSDRYPLVEAGEIIPALTPSQVARVDRSVIDDPESKIGDRYPSFESRAIAQTRFNRPITIGAVPTRRIAAEGSATRQAANKKRRFNDQQTAHN